MANSNILDFGAKTTINIDGFKNICQATKSDLLKWLTAQMEEYYGKGHVVATGEYLFCEGTHPACLCAHLDTVHKEQPSEFVYNEINKTMTSPQGIGGDDRCGVYSVLKVLKEVGADNKPSLFFSTDEECGSASTRKAAIDLKMRIRGIGYLIQIDRHGVDDSVYYTCGNDAFQKWIDSFGFKKAYGTRTDICELMPAWDLAGVNLSSGYKNEHAVNEIVSFPDMEKTIGRVINILNATENGKVFTYCKRDTDNHNTASKYTGSPAGLSSRVFLTGDIVETTTDTVGFIYSTANKDRVGEYVAVLAMSPHPVISVCATRGEVCIEIDKKRVWVSTEDIILFNKG
jgi:hypothetical protein